MRRLGETERDEARQGRDGDETARRRFVPAATSTDSADQNAERGWCGFIQSALISYSRMCVFDSDFTTDGW